MIITLCVITVIVRLFSLYRCKKHCDIVIEYSRILILTLRSDMMLTLHDDMREGELGHVSTNETLCYWSNFSCKHFKIKKGPFFTTTRTYKPDFAGKNKEHVIYWDLEVVLIWSFHFDRKTSLMTSFFNFC